MDKAKKRIITGTDLRDDQSIAAALRRLMDFPEWESTRIDEWIDMIALSHPNNPSIPRFRASQPEQFELEIQGTDLVEIKPQQMTTLIRHVAIINRRYQERMGGPIISLVVI